MKYFIALNGPARSGKDTLAKFLKRDDWLDKYFIVHEVKFAHILKVCVHKFMGEKYVEELKHEPMELSEYGKTYRDAYISFSEDFAKPTYGQDIFGRILARAMLETYVPSWDKPRLFVASDSGFSPEYNAVEKALGPDNCFVVQLHREGYDFPGDSRSYWSTGREAAIITNNASTEEFKLNGVSVIRDLVKARKWHEHSEPKGTEI